LPDKLSGIFLRVGLDDPNQLEMPSEIEFSARTISIAGRRLTSTMPAKERFGHYPRESRPIMLTWSFGVHDPCQHAVPD
jgi:hypothetical protein